jgi:phosphate transport system substrate-binding protein
MMARLACPGEFHDTSGNRRALRLGRACAVALALLLGSPGVTADEVIRVGGTGSALGAMRLLGEAFTAGNPGIRIATVANLGSGGGIQAVVAGAIGLAVTSRPTNEKERRLGTVEIEYARTPFVFAVSAKSRVTAITSRELADIYAGKMVTWLDGSPIRIILRPANDRDSEIIDGISPDIRRAHLAARARPGVRLSETDQDAADDIDRIPGAIGPSSLAVIISEERALRALTLDGKEPTMANAASGAYPYYKQLFLVTGARR